MGSRRDFWCFLMTLGGGGIFGIVASQIIGGLWAYFVFAALLLGSIPVIHRIDARGRRGEDMSDLNELLDRIRSSPTPGVNAPEPPECYRPDPPPPPPRPNAWGTHMGRPKPGGSA